ncbi:hypothetical protein TH66_06000 [Carbonactinospora thermoautotrophica]|uniref:site-specific DNA-methyltransferase (adenine-specific) n=2 Tax=Carbonactinospora thermoautotrophica TaxID=1469144 RepID=A0A132N4I8_9ACTN|nr:type IIL restriction-modification enzyme MmeI [Carbonactinospora thermoautotrophica]KWX04860.1 hypothetical protein TH66_06000 [Carbonactinospora thermoautotrophica]
MPPRAAKPSDQHAEWLALLPVDGPFLALPILTEAFRQGLDTVPDRVMERVRAAYDQFTADPATLCRAWIDFVLAEVLGYDTRVLVTGPQIPVYEQRPGGPIRPDAAVVTGGGQERVTRLLVYRLPWGTNLERSGDGPAPRDAAAEVARASGHPLALVTNGRLWLLVHARSGEPTTVATFDADLWLEEPLLLRAFASLLSLRRLAGVPEDVTLAGLFRRSAEAQAEVTDTLGRQVRQAVELLVGEISRLDRESGGELLAGKDPREVYRGALTVMMRLVFLLYAEERRLLPLGEELYDASYAVSTLQRRLDGEASQHGEEIGDRRTAAWPRLLATFRLVHDGCEHEALRLPAYGGELFDPARYPWLDRLAVTDRVVREILDALLVLRRKGQGAQRLSYKGLDVEQIGHVYEGLLEYSCVRADEPYLGLAGKLEPELPLAELERRRDQPGFAGWLREQTGMTARQVEAALAHRPDPHELALLHAACDSDAGLAARARPFLGLLRRDLRGLPTVYPAGSVLVTQVSDRRSSGTHYTPRALAEEVVEHTLAPLCYSPGPAEGAEPGHWRAKTAEELLSLKIVDPAMGSGAFLVAACRYLADRVVEAWDRDGAPDELDLPADRDERLVIARRLVAERCVFGVDRDEMAVGLAKLSMWLVTLARHKPFSFLDHALRCGDSLIGVTRLDQVVKFHLNPAEGEFWNARLSGEIDRLVERVMGEATELRREIEAMPVRDVRDAEEKERKLNRAEKLTEGLRLAADAVVAAALSTAKLSDDAYDDRLNSISEPVQDALHGDTEAERKVRDKVDAWLKGPRPEPVRPFHWPLEFPEVFARGGFDAVVGNPPFVGGQRITGTAGEDYRDHLVRRIARGRRGSADLCAYFFLRDLDIAPKGRVGVIATNTIAQGDTREVGLEQAVQRGWTIYRGEKTRLWPGTASVVVSLVWAGRAPESEPRILDGWRVRDITPALDPQSRVTGTPYRLAANAGKSFIGSYVLGMGFVLEPEQAHALIEADPRNAEVLFPYLNGEDLNSRPDCSASRWVINFHDWPLEKAKTYPEPFRIVEEKVKPQRLQQHDQYGQRYWWRFLRTRPELYEAIKDLSRVLVIARISRTGMPVLVPCGQVLNEKIVVFATDSSVDLALISSELHRLWAHKYSATLKTDLQYTPSDCFETFPQPDPTSRTKHVGAELEAYRRPLMLRRQLGLTALYNRVNDPDDHDPAIARLREIHVEIDEAVREAYGWDDLELKHGFYETRQGMRFTVAPDVQVEICDRLLELNHQRYEEEVARGLHSKKRSGRPAGGRAEPESWDGALFPPDGALF